MASGNLITRNYTNFRGVDFTDTEVALTRSPDSLNMWKNYSKLGKCIETRPDIELVEAYDNTIFGLFFYRVGNKEMMLVHSGTTLYKVVDGVREVLYTGLNPKRSNAFIYNNIWYFKDGINYLEYNGETIGEVVGYIPTTSIGRSPNGGGTIYEDVNMLTGIRKNGFSADGESTEYYLDAQNIDTDFMPIVIVNDEEVTDFTVDTTKGMITFATAPSKPLTVGQDNVTITYRRTVQGYRERINKCTLLQVFDNRVFFSGNQDYPNTVWHCSLNDPSYCSDLDYYNEGLDLSPVKGMVAGNNALWVFKEPSQANTTVFYHNPTIDAEYGKIYPSTHSSIATGCIGGAINFNDDICFFSDRGMEAINGDVTTEQVLAHRSSLIDSKLLNESNYKDMILEEWEGYLLVIIGKHIYLADSNASYQNNARYEWFYWEIEKEITYTKVKDGVLYLCSNDGIYKLGQSEEYTEVTFTEEEGQYVLYGESVQNGTPTPDNPIEIVNTYKAGKYKTTIDGREYRFILDDDLRSVGEVKDKIFINDGQLFIKKKINTVVLNGNETISRTSAGTGEYRFLVSAPEDIIVNNDSAAKGFLLCDKLIETTNDATYLGEEYGIHIRTNNVCGFVVYAEETKGMSSGEFRNWLSENNLKVFYTLATPTTEELNYLASPLSYWTTPYDEFNYPQYQKTTNKRGSVTDMKGTNITISTKIDNNDFEEITTHENITSYVVNRIKKKKWKGIQLKFSSYKPFELYSSTLEAYIGGYIKR